MRTPALLRFLTRRNTVLLALFFLIWVVALDLLWFIPTRKSLENSASELSLQVADSASATIRSFLENDLTSVENASADILEQPSRTQEALDRLVRRNSFVLHVVLVDRNGAVLKSSGDLPLGESEPDYSKLPGVYVAFAGTTNVGDVESRSDGTPVSYIAAPVVHDGVADTALIAEVSLRALKEDIAAYKSGQWHLYVVDKHGNEIFGPDVGSSVDLLARPVVQKVVVDGLTVDGLSPADSYVDQGVQMFAVGQPIPLATWSLFVERPKSEAFAAVTIIELLAAAIFLLGAIAITLAMVSYWRLDELNDRLRTQSAELKDRNERLQELDEAKSEFVSVAAHQLRTPLSALKWILGILIDENSGNLTPEQKSLLFKGAESNERMISLINEMLVVTRIESGRAKFDILPIHIEDLIDSVILDFSVQAHVRKMNLSFEKPSAQLPTIAADAEKIRNVVQNLIENAMRYTNDGGAITIRATEAKERGFVEVSVTDTGIGIPLKQRANIFNKFFRADNAVKHQTDGSGLGLFIAKTIVEKHGGTIRFESEEGKGTTFFFTLPVSTATVAPKP